VPELHTHCIEVIAALTMLIGVGGIILNRVVTGKGIGVRVNTVFCRDYGGSYYFDTRPRKATGTGHARHFNRGINRIRTS